MPEAFPLDWPDGRERAKFRTTSKFKVSFTAARDHLYNEIELMGGKRAILSSNLELRFDGLPKAGQANPTDPGVAVYFEYKGKPMVFVCARYSRVWENIRSIGLTIEALRAIERYGTSDMMERAFRGFAALPERAGEWWREVLGFEPGVKPSVDDIEDRFRQLAHAAHPDKGGDVNVWHQLVKAREDARKWIGVTR